MQPLPQTLHGTESNFIHYWLDVERKASWKSHKAVRVWFVAHSIVLLNSEARRFRCVFAGVGFKRLRQWNKTWLSQGPTIIFNQHGRVGSVRMHFAHLLLLAYYADRPFLFFLLLLSSSLRFCLAISYYVFFMVWLLYVNVLWARFKSQAIFQSSITSLRRFAYSAFFAWSVDRVACFLRGKRVATAHRYQSYECRECV